MHASEFIEPKARFMRSANVERDAGRTDLDGFLPTGRALDVVARLMRSILDPYATRAFSITGPYGTGKSSLAVFIDALLGDVAAPAFASALTTLELVDHDLASQLQTARRKFNSQAFLPAIVTATREPVAHSVVRALDIGARRLPVGRRNAALKDLRRRTTDVVATLGDPNRDIITNRLVLDLLESAAALSPVLLLIDEFGKNLEAFAESRSEADLYLLQEIVEWAHRSDDAKPVVTITMQHLSFEDYLDSVSQGLRREWAKVQGRFEDIPYVDTPAQTRHLISQVYREPTNTHFNNQRRAWASEALAELRSAGLGHEIEPETIERSWPLHPSTLLVLPELCSRYGQNERTLFSFLASAEPHSVTAWLVNERLSGELRDVRLDRVYDYFVESALTAAATSQTASRWVEVETAIRDATGLTAAQRRVLKAVGLLNLVSAGGSVRASGRVLSWACNDGAEGTSSPGEVRERLAELEAQGRITFREFADEFRLWRGSDLDLRAAIEAARRRVRQVSLEGLLGGSRVMLPVVAARHSTESGTLRVFQRLWDSDGSLEGHVLDDGADGLLVYVLGPKLPAVPNDLAKPVVAVRPSDAGPLVTSAIELAAVRSVLQDVTVIGDDWVARRELLEREAEALSAFDSTFEATVGHLADGTKWFRALPRMLFEEVKPPASVTAALSAVCDEVYVDSPPVANEMLNRHDLTSQGAKARRILVEGLLTRLGEERFGIEGFPPERAMYDAVFGPATGIHRNDGNVWKLHAPSTQAWKPVWKHLRGQFAIAKTDRLKVDAILRSLQAPPIGLKAGVAPVVFAAGVVAHSDEVALYEHGTYTPRFTPEVAERLLRNPAHFQVKHFNATSGVRRRLVAALAEALNVTSWRDKSPTVLSVVGNLVFLVNGLPEYAKQTRHLSDVALRLRQAIKDALEPDVLLFETLPQAFALAPPGRQHEASIDPELYGLVLTAALSELTNALPRLLADVARQLREATKASTVDYRRELAGRAERLSGHVLDQRLRSFLFALSDTFKDGDAWLEHVAMSVSAGPGPSSWGDADLGRYEANVRELGGALRRIEAIYMDRLAVDSEAFDAFRVTVTRTDGAEWAQVVGVEPAILNSLGDRVQALVDDVSDAMGPAVAVEAVLVALAQRLSGQGHGELSQPPHKVVGEMTTEQGRGV